MHERYSHINGTHCWFCDRQFMVNESLLSKYAKPLIRTKEHIVPRSRGNMNRQENYIASCYDCNTLKGNRDAKEFAIHIAKLIQQHIPSTHVMYGLFKKIRDRAWKLYNKKSRLHKLQYNEGTFAWEAKERPFNSKIKIQ